MAVRLSALRAGCLLPPGRLLAPISVRGWVDPRDMVQLEGLGQLKNTMILSGIEPATFRFVTQCLSFGVLTAMVKRARRSQRCFQLGQYTCALSALRCRIASFISSVLPSTDSGYGRNPYSGGSSQAVLYNRHLEPCFVDAVSCWNNTSTVGYCAQWMIGMGSRWGPSVFLAQSERKWVLNRIITPTFPSQSRITGTQTWSPTHERKYLHVNEFSLRS
jgi:hypothetical protein